PLPEHLKVPLGQTIRIGALEMTPTKVRRQRMSIVVAGFQRPEEMENDSLVLYLKVKNRAEHYAFTPLDNFFDRQWKGSGPPPYTLLQAGKETFFGGPAPWVSTIEAQRSDKRRREWVQGRKNIDTTGLAPGEEEETFTCTDGSDQKIARYLFGVDRH